MIACASICSCSMNRPRACRRNKSRISSILLSGSQDRNRTAILVEHRMDMVMSISHVITVMNQGRVLAEGDQR